MQRFRKSVVAAAVVTMVAVFMFMMMKSNLKHVEDTNGADNYKPVTFTDSDIIDMKTGALNPCTVRDALIGNGVEFSSDKFTGVYEILYADYILPSDFELEIQTLNVTEGNFRMVVVHEDKIVAEIQPNSEELITTVRLENITGYVSLRIVGESAAYTFQMNPLDYESFSHP